MKKLQMVDLQTQYKFIKDQVDSSVIEIFKRGTFINGPSVKEFQSQLEDYLNVKHVIPCANGTDALQIALMSLDLKPGDEIITSDFTFAATVEVIALLRLKPVLVDIDEDTFNIDCDEIIKAITPKTKAIIPVHLFGQVANMNKVMEIAKANNLFVVEDNAQAIGAIYNSNKKSGTIGHLGTTSFFPSKNLGCFGDGGAIFTNDDNLADKIRMVCNHGQSKKYHHRTVGVNSRLHTLQAAILDIKLKHLDEYCASRQAVAAKYDSAFATHPDLTIPHRDDKSTHVFHQYTLKLSDSVNREDMRNYLSNHGIPSMVYYPLPLNKQEAYSSDDQFSVTEDLCSRVLSLPISTELSDEQTDATTENVKTYLDNK